MTPLELLAMGGAGLVAGFVNTLAGGGSMLMVPALMVAGVPADLANGTTRVPILAQCATSASTFWHAGKLERGPTLDVTPLTMLGALAGAWVATMLPNRIFEPLLLGTMVVMALTMVLRTETLAPPEGTAPRKVMGAPLAMLLTLTAGFYGGILQAGAGLVFLALFSGVLRYDLVRANALKAIVMLAYIAVTVGVFAWQAMIVWDAAAAMGAGCIVGAFIGARVALGRGATRWIRWLVIAMVIATAAWVLVR